MNTSLNAARKLPIVEIAAQLDQIGGAGNASQFFIQLGDHPATAAVVLSVQTDQAHPVALHDDFQIHVTLLLREPLNLEALLGSPAVFMRMAAGKLIPLHGVIAHLQASQQVNDPNAVDLLLASPLYVLKKHQHNRVFVDRDALDIATELLQEALGHLCDVQPQAEKPAAAAMITQYQETDYDFIRRILAQEGIFIHLSQGDTRTTLYLISQFEDSVPEAGKTFRLPYITNSGAAKNKDHISFIERQHWLAPTTLRLKNYNPDTGHDLTINGRSPTGSTTLGETELWGLNYPIPEAGEQLERQLAGHYYWQSRQLELVTSCSALLPGQIIQITGHKEYNGNYRIIRLLFSGDQVSLNNSGGNGQEFLCRASVLPLDVDYVPGYQPRNNLPLALSARITEEVDEQGCYRIRYPFDERDDAAGYSSLPTRSLRPFGGESHGLHFPLAQNSEVVVSGLNGDLDRPVILGAVFHQQAPDLVNNSNPHTHLILTRGGHTLRMQDEPGKEHICLATAEEKNRLQLDATTDAHKAQLISEEGDIELQAGQNLLLQTGSNMEITVGEDQQIEIGGNETLLTEEGDIQISAGQNLTLDAAQDISWRAEEGNLTITVGADLIQECSGNSYETLVEGNYSLIVEEGSYLLEAASDVALSSEGGNLTLTNGSSTLQISSDGNLLLEGTTIELAADNILGSGSALSNN